MLSRLRQGYLRTIGALVAGMMAITVVVTCLQVIYRYVLNDALIWAEEICRYLLVWTSFLAAGLAFRTALHFQIIITHFQRNATFL